MTMMGSLGRGEIDLNIVASRGDNLSATR